MTGISIHNATEVVRPPEDGLPYLRHDRAATLITEPGSISIRAGRIAGFEPDFDAGTQLDASGGAIVPGFVDCHTHLPFFGWRAEEYEQKVTGVPYEEIARSGGGIASSARALAETPDHRVLAQSRTVAEEMLRLGTTTFECKSGYGLSADAELRALRLAAMLGETARARTVTTALLAHAIPQGFTADAWMDEVERMLPDAAGVDGVQALDIYVESVAFANEHLARMGELAAAHGLHLRAHVEQFACHRSVPVALDAGARSVDHLAKLHPDDIAPLAASETAAVLLPGAEFLGNEDVAPARALADAGAVCVLATDCNPGTSPVTSMPLVAGLAVRRYGWTAREAILAMTLNAAWVLDRSQDTGSLEVGKRADVLILDCPLAHLPYRFGRNPVAVVIVGGEIAWMRRDQVWRAE